MGVLDDAIREHLELKLKHGASEEEVRRQEAEALGAVRREPAPEAGLPDEEAGADEVHVVEPELAPFEIGASEAEPEDGREPFDERREDEDAFEERISSPPTRDEASVVERDADDYEPAPEPQDEAAYPEGDSDETGFERRDPAENTVLMERVEDEEVVFVEEGEPPPPEERSARDVVLEPPPEEGLADEEAALEVERSAEALDEARPHEPREAGPGEGGKDMLEETPDFLQETPEHDRLWFEQKPPRDFDFD